VGGWRSGPSALRALARGVALRLLRCSSLEQRLQLLPHTPLLGGCGLRACSSMAAAAKFWDACLKSGRAPALAFAPPFPRQLLSGSGACAGSIGARPRD
jgi:hypothetical protein